MSKIFFVVLACLVVAGCGNITKGKAAAESQVPVFHQRYNDEDFEAIIAASHPDMFKVTPESEVKDFLIAIGDKLGKVTNTQAAKWNVRSFNGVTTVVLIQSTTFENGKGTETFTFIIKSEQASLVGYNINSKDLIMK